MCMYGDLDEIDPLKSLLPFSTRKSFPAILDRIQRHKSTNMEQLPAFGYSIEEVLHPTFGAYEKLLTAKETEIRSTRRETYRYGSHPRQELDVYYPTTTAPTAPFVAKPVLVFIYGGGFVGGDRTYPGYANGLFYANLGHFFASRFGFTVVVPDYRLLSHGAKYPSGGEDVKLTIDWVQETLAQQDGYGSIDLFVMGNSAGGVHTATYLFDAAFAEARAPLLAATRTGDGVLLRGAVLLGVPPHWGSIDNESLRAYLGEGQVYDHAPMGVLEALRKKNALPDLPGVGIALFVSERDPEFITATVDDFRRALPRPDDVEVVSIEGHNHISPPLGLGTGIEREEAWGVRVVEFFKANATRLG
ncbi:Alpha/Beta hydrolase protein [Biscogniauxia sp. FL1348]|nr:Alpha/Beta hydrolase protein [Biscogniauxia sp. FL1348]